jgi:dsDNA-specific endonuclease/ATPase MutS2
MFYTWNFGFAGVRGPYYHYKRKMFLYNEVKQRVLASEYFGNQNEIEHYKLGFNYWGDSREFWMNKRMYRLPRPIDKQAIEQIHNKEKTITREKRN